MAMDSTNMGNPDKTNQGWSDNAGTPRKRRVGWTDGIRPGKTRQAPGIQDEGGMNVNEIYKTY
jgi:hypothetical protein